MPSFFYHLVCDLETASSDTNTRPKLWKAFKAVGKPISSRAHARSPSENQRILNNKQGQSTFASAIENPADKPLENTQKQVALKSKTGEDDGLGPPSKARDWRYGRLLSQGFEMATLSKDTSNGDSPQKGALLSNGITAGSGSLSTKGRFESSSPEDEELGWGVIRLYRDGQETPGLDDEPVRGKNLKVSNAVQRKGDAEPPAFNDEDCTTLCILAVPSYLTPSDFLGFVGEKTREEVSHFRMIRTERGNRYMVLMKFRNGKRARQWKRNWNGKAFDGIEPETAQVVFISSITFLTPSSSPLQPTSYPTVTNDPFTPNQPASSRPATSKPLAPPTPALIELPTCPVCLERMDESTGLLTILCQHVFHCSCLQKWHGSGCPVCRYTQTDSSKRTLYSQSSTEALEGRSLNECDVCHSEVNLWICLICGSVGCGRYDAAHAFSHYNDTGHAFALDMETQRVWDYSSDSYVHRLVQNAHDGKLVDLSTPEHGGGLEYPDAEDDYDDFIPRSKLQNAGVEYTALLTSQLDSQRMYFEGILERAADKASLACQSAEKAVALAEKTQAQLEGLQAQRNELVQNVVPQLEKDKNRAERRAEKFETMARKMETEWREEKNLAGGLMERIKHLEEVVERTGKEKEGLLGEKGELEETVRDLMFTLSGSQKIAELEGAEGGSGTIQGGSVSLPERPKESEGSKNKKKKGKK